MAFGWWVATGTFKQMEREIITSKEFSGHFEIFWKSTNEAKIDTLHFEHVLPSLILLGCGLGPAMVAFLMELLKHSYKKGPAPGSISRKRPGKIKVQVKC